MYKMSLKSKNDLKIKKNHKNPSPSYYNCVLKQVSHLEVGVYFVCNSFEYKGKII